MSHSAPEALAALCRTLLPASQESLVQFARFLQEQEARAGFDQVDEEDEAAWDRAFRDPGQVANFTRWADRSLSRSAPQPFDPSRL